MNVFSMHLTRRLSLELGYLLRSLAKDVACVALSESQLQERAVAAHDTWKLSRSDRPCLR